MDKLEILDQLAKSRLAFFHALEGLSVEQIQQVLVEGTWTIKDLLAHLTSWEKACLVPLRSYAAGGAFIPEPIPDYGVWNERQSRDWRSQSLAEILVEGQIIRDELVTLIVALPEERSNEKLPAPWGERTTVAELFSGLVWHESTEHLKSIEQWKETGKPR